MAPAKPRAAPTLHPFLLAVGPIIALYAQNAHEVVAEQVIFPFLMALVACTGLMWVLFATLGGWHRAGIVASAALLAFFTYGHAYTWTQFPVRLLLARLGIHQQHPHWFFFLLFAGIIAGVWLLVRKRGGQLQGVTQTLNVVLSVFVLINAGTLALALLGEPASLPELDEAAFFEGGAATLQAPERLPDVYYIVLDGYARADILADLYAFDNQPFLDDLGERGFFVAENATSNYPLTFLSLPAGLNFDYLDDVAAEAGPESRSFGPLHRATKHNRAVALFESMGYETVHLGSGWPPTEANPWADVNLMCAEFNEFNQILVETTMLRPLEIRVGVGAHRERIGCQFDFLEGIANLDAPTFTTAHFLTPHPPFVFDADGGIVTEVSPSLQGPAWRTDLFAAQTAYINGRILEAIDRIVAASDVPPIILLQSDHGPSSMQSNQGNSDNVLQPIPDDLEQTRDPVHVERLQERYPILAAYLAPQGEFYANMTPVNALRIVLNGHFNGTFDLLPDRNVFALYGYPYDQQDVTRIVHGT